MEVPMPLIQGGPPEWTWERTPNLLKWSVAQAPATNGHPVFELRVTCGLEILRLQFFTKEELKELGAVIDQWADGLKSDNRIEPMHRTRKPGSAP